MADLRLVVFRLGSLICAAPATGVREVISSSVPTRIPGARASVIGLMNVRGTLLTVVDGRILLGYPAGPADSVLVLKQGERTVGLMVDEVLDLADVAEDSLSPGDELPGVDPRLVRAVGHQGDRVFALLDPAALIAPVLG
jgi:purine-binding chemotaxis protein CheW